MIASAKLAGFPYLYTRITSKVSLKMMLKLGAEVVNEIEFVEGEFREKIWLIKINLINPFPTYSMLKAMSTKKVDPKPKI